MKIHVFSLYLLISIMVDIGRNELHFVINRGVAFGVVSVVELDHLKAKLPCKLFSHRYFDDLKQFAKISSTLLLLTSRARFSTLTVS